MSGLQCLLYMSHATRAMSQEEIDRLLGGARERNRLRGVTGALLYYDGRFVQVLEGEAAAVDQCFALIQTDARHEQVQPFEFAFRGDRPLDWSPDRKRLLFASLRSDSVQIYEWERESGDVRAMTVGPEDHSTACYLPDGRLAVAGMTRGPESRKREASPSKRSEASGRVSRIYLSEPGGGQLRPLTAGPTDTKPACSSRRIARPL